MPAAGITLEALAARPPAAPSPFSDAGAPRRSVDPAPRAAAAFPCPRILLPCRCRGSPAIAAARTIAVARHRSAMPRLPAQNLAQILRGAPDDRLPRMNIP